MSIAGQEDQKEPNKDKELVNDISHLGNLVSTTNAMSYIGNPVESKFQRLRKHNVYVPHEGGSDARINMYFVNCLKVRFGIFENLRRRRTPPKFTQAMIGILLNSEFGEDDQLLKDQLLKEKPDQIIKNIINKAVG